MTIDLFFYVRDLGSYRTASLEFLECLYWGGIEGDGGAARSWPTP